MMQGQQMMSGPGQAGPAGQIVPYGGQLQGADFNYNQSAFSELSNMQGNMSGMQSGMQPGFGSSQDPNAQLAIPQRSRPKYEPGRQALAEQAEARAKAKPIAPEKQVR